MTAAASRVPAHAGVIPQETSASGVEVLSFSLLPEPAWAATWGLFETGSAPVLLESQGELSTQTLTAPAGLPTDIPADHEGGGAGSLPVRAVAATGPASGPGELARGARVEVRCGGLPVPFELLSPGLGPWVVLDAHEQASAAQVTALAHEPLPLSVPTPAPGPVAAIPALERWMRVCFEAEPTAAPPFRLVRLGLHSVPPPQTTQAKPLLWSLPSGLFELSSGALTLSWDTPGQPLPTRVRWHNQSLLMPGAASALRLVAPDGLPLRLGAFVPQVVRSGPLETVLEWTGLAIYDLASSDGARAALEVELRYISRAGLAGVLVELTLQNPQAAQHRNNQWALGDPGSRFLGEVALQLRLPGDAAGAPIRTQLTLGPDMNGRPSQALAANTSLRIEQQSSGRPGWQSPSHVDFRGDSLARGAGYQLRWDGQSQSGAQAVPVLQVSSPSATLMVVPDRFWEQFPRALSMQPEPDGTAMVTYEIFPRWQEPARIRHFEVARGLGGQWRRARLYPHELQGGERITARLYLGAAEHQRAISPSHAQRLASRLARGMDFQPGPAFERLALLGWGGDSLEPLDPPNAAVAPVSREPLAATLETVVRPQGKSPRTLINVADFHDAYGWRDFGDFQADHETRCGQNAWTLRAFVSHYNNQYDLVAGIWRQWLRGAAPAWLEIALAAGRHGADIDTYHTRLDTPAYNGGMFWHTTHDTPADRSTHRSYPMPAVSRGCTDFKSGGPGLGHVYLDGLLMGWQLTADRSQLRSALELGAFIVQRWQLDPTDREPRAQANTLRSLVALCQSLESPRFCGEANRISQALLRVESPFPSPTGGRATAPPDWQQLMLGEAVLRWKRLLPVTMSAAMPAATPAAMPAAMPAAQTEPSTPEDPSFWRRRADQWVLGLCLAIESQRDALPMDVNRWRAADLLAACQDLGPPHPDFRASVLKLVQSLDTTYWARGTYPNAKELAILLSCGGRARRLMAGGTE